MNTSNTYRFETRIGKRSLCFGCRLRYEQRSALAKNSMAKRCFEIMARKQTNLSVAADVATAEEMLTLADAVGPHICVFKTHVDIFNEWDTRIVAKLQVGCALPVG